MPRTIALIDDFSVGEVSPLTEAKISSDEFKNGLREATNVVPDSHGPIIGRPGFEHVRPVTVPAGAKSATLFTINYSPEEFFIVVLYHLKIEVCTQDGQILYEAAAPFTDVDLHGKDGKDHLVYAFLSPAGKELIILTGIHKPYIVKMTKPATENDPWTSVFEAITFTNQPSQWTDNNYPTTGTYFQGRTWWGGCEEDPDRFFASKSNAHFDLGYGSPPVDSDGIEFQISRHGRIRWIQGGRQLLIGTEAGEFIVTSEAGVITPTDLQVELQSAFGSKRLQSELIGNEAVYVTSDGRKLRSMWWKWIEAGWVSLDATFTSEHLTRPGITDIAFSRNPYSNVWMLLGSGDLIACSYRREKDQDPIVGWFRVSSDAMRFVTVTVAENLGTSDLWTIVKSKTDDEHAFHMMRYAPHDYIDPERVFLDGFVELKNANTNKPDFSGKFFDQPISVVADGFHIPNMVQNTDGTIDLPLTADHIIAGYPYMQRAVTMPLIKVGEQGASTHHMKRWNKVFLRMIQSYMPKVNGERAPERNVSTPNDTPEPFLDSFVQVTPGLGWDRDGILTIEQDLPFRMIITGVYGEVSVDNI